MSARLYAVEIDGTPVTVRAEVVYPSREDAAFGERIWVDFEAVGGVRVSRLPELTDAEWEALQEAVIAQDVEQRAAEREALAG